MKKRKSPYERPDEPINVRETKRVEDMCVWMLEHRILNFRQWVRLLNRGEATVKDIMRRLYDGYYLNRIEYPTEGYNRNPAVYTLDVKGVDLLERLGYDVGAIPKQGFKIPHTLGLADIRISITQHIEAMGWKLLYWKSEYDFSSDYHKVLLSGHRRETALQPDGFFVVELPNKRVSAFFLEFDRSTENIKKFIKKTKCYVEFHNSGGFTKTYGYKGFRVLSVIEDKARRRLDNLTKIIGRESDIKKRFWLTHLDDINEHNPLTSPIWDIAGDANNARLFEA